MIGENTLNISRDRLLAFEALSRDQRELETTSAVAESRKHAIRELLAEVLRLGQELETLRLQPVEPQQPEPPSPRRLWD